jgi:hypothetical protein
MLNHAVGAEEGVDPGVEEWRKWSPRLGDPMSPSSDPPWIDVEKAVLTRTFMLADDEVVGPAPHVDDTLSGCVCATDLCQGGWRHNGCPVRGSTDSPTPLEHPPTPSTRTVVTDAK